MALLEHNQNKRVALLYVSEWSNADAARRMFDSYRKVRGAKWKAMKVTSEAATSLSGTSEDGVFRLSLDGTRVLSIEGAEPRSGTAK
jgi:hypothetical protein